MEFTTYFVYFRTLSYKFKVQQTLTEFGPPVGPQEKEKAKTVPFPLSFINTVCAR